MPRTFGTIARRGGLRPSPIRYYEKTALLPKPIRVSGQRRYDETVLQRLAIIRFAKYVGFNLTETSQLLQGATVRPPTDRWRRMAHERIRDLDAAIEHAALLRGVLQDTLM